MKKKSIPQSYGRERIPQCCCSNKGLCLYYYKNIDDYFLNSLGHPSISSTVWHRKKTQLLFAGVA